MKINLHFLPEKPTEACRVITFSSWSEGNLSTVHDTTYSPKWDMFMMLDETEEVPFCIYKSNQWVIAWAYLDEVREELFNEIQ